MSGPRLAHQGSSLVGLGSTVRWRCLPWPGLKKASTTTTKTIGRPTWARSQSAQVGPYCLPTRSLVVILARQCVRLIIWLSFHSSRPLPVNRSSHLARVDKSQAAAACGLVCCPSHSPLSFCRLSGPAREMLPKPPSSATTDEHSVKSHPGRLSRLKLARGQIYILIHATSCL